MQSGRLKSIEKMDNKLDQNILGDFELLTVHSRSSSRLKISDKEIEHLKALKRIKDALSKFDLSKNEVRVYIFLARFGAQKAQRIAEALNVHRTEAYKILRRLERQGLVSCIFERPMKFVSIPFERALGNLIEERRQRIYQMELWKKELLKTWDSLPKPKNRILQKEMFQVLEGRKQVSVKAIELLDNSSNRLLMVLNDEHLLWLYNSPFFDDLEKISKKQEFKVNVMTNFTPTSAYVFEEINLKNGDFVYKDLEKAPCFIVSDSGHMLLLMERNRQGRDKPFAIWTNYKTLVESYKLLFNLLWE